MIDQSPPPDLDALPENLPPMPQGVFFGGFRDFCLERQWVFCDRVTGGRFCLPQSTSAEELTEEVEKRRKALIGAVRVAPRKPFLRTTRRSSPDQGAAR